MAPRAVFARLNINNKTCIMNPLSKKTVPLVLAVLWLLWITQPALAQSDDVSPVFRPRTDANAERDLQLLRDALNQATDVDGDVNPLGRFHQRSAEPKQRARIEIGPAKLDEEAQKKPTIDSKSFQSKPTQSIGILPGPRYTIIQQASPQARNVFVDDFRPVRSNVNAGVSLASATLPIAIQPSSYLANYQDIPGTGANSGFVPQPFPNSQGYIPNTNPILPNTNPILPDASIRPTLPFNPGAMPSSNMVVPLTYGTPIPNGVTGINPGINPGIINNPPTNFQTQPNYNPMGGNPAFNSGVPMRSPSDSVMPNSQRSSSVVNGAPFVSSPPCQFDARSMVSPRVYRQAVDPCVQPTCGSPYASSPYATQPGGSPFSYVPPTGMPYANNGSNSGFRPLIGFGQSLANAYLGRGIIGQPTAYVDGQPVRNFIRYLFP